MGNFNPNKQSVMGLADSLIQFFNKGIKANNIADNAIITSLLANESVTKEKILQSSLKEWLESMFNESPVWFLPTGFPFYWPGSTPPDGAIEQNGAELLRSDYQNLWTFANNSGNIVTEAAWSAGRQGSFSTGNLSTTFRIPDGRGVVARSLDNGRGLDSGRVLGSYQADAFQGHWHIIDGIGSEIPSPYYRNAAPGASGNSAFYTFQTASASPGSAGYATDNINGTPRTASETRMKNNAWLCCIKT
jgi:hypothetical protein